MDNDIHFISGAVFLYGESILVAGGEQLKWRKSFRNESVFNPHAPGELA